MKLDDLKASWSQYDKGLSENLKLNEEQLQKLNMSMEKREFKDLFDLEIISIVGCSFVGTMLFVMSLYYINELKYSIPGLIASLVMFIQLYFSIITLSRSKKIDYYQSSVVKLQKDITELTQLVLRIRRYEFLLAPVFAITIFPIVYKATGMDVYSNVTSFIIKIVIVIVFGGGFGIWFNKNYVDKKMNNIKRFLEDIAAFEKEE